MTEEKGAYYKNTNLLIFTCLLFIAVGFLFYQDLKTSRHELTFAMLDVGQGDGLFIESPTGTQVLVDGGPARKITSKLGRVMSPFDRHIDALIITNPDADHIGGFLDILKTYKVDQVFEPGTSNDSRTYQNLKQMIKDKNIEDIIVTRGMRLDLGGGAVIDVLFPDRDVSLWDSNDGSIVSKLVYGETSVMLTGDATVKTEGIVLSENSPSILKSTILKVGHHGSRTSSSLNFVKNVSPGYALISDGKDNKYGHPHPETLDTLNSLGIQTYRTDLLGSIIMKSDGKNEAFSFKK